MCQLVRNHTLQLVIRKHLQNSLGCCYCCMFWISSGSECIRRISWNDIYFRHHRKACRYFHLLHHVKQLRLDIMSDFLRIAGCQQNSIAAIKTDAVSSLVFSMIHRRISLLQQFSRCDFGLWNQGNADAWRNMMNMPF